MKYTENCSNIKVHSLEKKQGIHVLYGIKLYIRSPIDQFQTFHKIDRLELAYFQIKTMTSKLIPVVRIST